MTYDPTPALAPRPYWAGLDDDALIRARDEYRRGHPDDPQLAGLADAIDDDLGRRAAQRTALGH